MTTLRNNERYRDVTFVMNRLLNDHALPHPDKVSFNIVIDALGKANHFYEMERMLMHMMQVGYDPDVRTFTSMLSAYIKSRQGVAVLQMLDFMQAAGVHPNKYTYRVLNLWERNTIGLVHELLCE